MLDHNFFTSTFSQRVHIIGHRKYIRSITRSCITCRSYSAKPKPQVPSSTVACWWQRANYQLKLPTKRVTPDSVFERTGVDYTGPLYIKYKYTRKSTVVKTYECMFVSLTIKAVHLELLSDLSSGTFIACLRHFIARRGLPTLIWSDNGTNVGASRELKELAQFLKLRKTQCEISEFCSIHWKFIPEHAPNFGGLWEAAVKNFKQHFSEL